MLLTGRFHMNRANKPRSDDNCSKVFHLNFLYSQEQPEEGHPESCLSCLTNHAASIRAQPIDQLKSRPLKVHLSAALLLYPVQEL
jgi:hypothetical protein